MENGELFLAGLWAGVSTTLRHLAILVDEYDKPILGNILNDNVKNILEELKGFYGIIKSCESKERFIFITGVSKFSKVSVFMDARFANMMGYTQEELEVNFGKYLKPLAEEQKLITAIF